MSELVRTAVDFLLLAPLNEEREALLAHLPGAQRLQPDEQDVRFYYQADVSTEFPGGARGTYRVIVTSPLGMGRVEAATATSDAIRRWQPRYVILCGIAGGDPENVELGDVLVAEQLADYEQQKITTDGARVRYQSYRSDPRLYGAAQHLLGWEAAVEKPRPSPGRPRCHFGVVISGDKVQAAKDALKPYRSDWPKLIGVEMEAGGVAAAAWQAPSKPGVLMVRGVSDLADEKKGSGRVKKWRPYACEVAAAYTVALLRSGSVPLTRPKSIEPITIITSPPKSEAAGHMRGISVVAEPPQREVLRVGLIKTLLEKLEQERRLLILSPRRGGARTLVRQMVERSGFAQDALTRLSPSPLAKTAADYFAALTGDPNVQNAMAFDAWQRRRLRLGSDRHLIVLLHDGGEPELLSELAEVLRGCQQDPRFHILVAGEARAAVLKYGLADTSYFSGMPDERVPELHCEELQVLLGCTDEEAAAVWAATGGHPGLVRAAVRAGGPRTEEALAAQLARVPDVRDILARRLQEDDRKLTSQGRHHAAPVLRALLQGQPVRALEDLSNDLRFPEVRLYFDGMLRSEADGVTRFRCEAVRRAATVALRNWEDVQA